MSQSCKDLFEQELARRDVAFTRDIESGRHLVERADGTRVFISLDNLSREFERDEDPGRISRFVDMILTGGSWPQSWEDARPKLFLALEPRLFAEPPDVARKVSNQVDCIPVLSNFSIGAMTWVSRPMLEDWSVTEDAIFREATENLDQALQSATLEYREIDGKRLATISSDLPVNAPLMLASGFRRFAEPVLGWPILVVAPARDFFYLCNARDGELIERLGGVVLQKFGSSPYPLSTELLELTDEGLRAIGEFSANSDDAR